MKLYWIDSGANVGGFKWTGGDTVDRANGALVESIIGDENFKRIWWLEKALAASKHIARVKLAGGSATGFLIGNDIFMTNNHVFEDEQDAKNSKLQFNYRMLGDGAQAPIDEWRCDPEEMFKTNPELDYSIVKVKKKSGKDAGEVWGHFDLRHNQTVYEGQRVNIIQHPRGRYMEIAFRDNQVKAVEDSYVQYITDTDYGSSGSPVLDDWFNVVALHNQRVRDPNYPSRWHRNQGFKVEAILEDAAELIP